jgi:hypothetical protein
MKACAGPDYILHQKDLRFACRRKPCQPHKICVDVTRFTIGDTEQALGRPSRYVKYRSNIGPPYDGLQNIWPASLSADGSDLMPAQTFRAFSVPLIAHGPLSGPPPTDPGSFAWEILRRRADYAEAISPISSRAIGSVTLIDGRGHDAMPWGLCFRRGSGTFSFTGATVLGPEARPKGHHCRRPAHGPRRPAALRHFFPTSSCYASGPLDR